MNQGKLPQSNSISRHHEQYDHNEAQSQTPANFQTDWNEGLLETEKPPSAAYLLSTWGTSRYRNFCLEPGDPDQLFLQISRRARCAPLSRQDRVQRFEIFFRDIPVLLAGHARGPSDCSGEKAPVFKSEK